MATKASTLTMGILPSLGILILRLGFGLPIALTHGWSKAQQLTSTHPQFADPLHIGLIPSLALATFGELVCGLLVAIGLATRLAALPFAITLGVAFFIAHGDDPFARREMAFLYMVAALAIACLGGGPYSVDALIGRHRRR